MPQSGRKQEIGRTRGNWQWEGLSKSEEWAEREYFTQPLFKFHSLSSEGFKKIKLNRLITLVHKLVKPRSRFHKDC